MSCFNVQLCEGWNKKKREEFFLRQIVLKISSSRWLIEANGRFLSPLYMTPQGLPYIDQLSNQTYASHQLLPLRKNTNLIELISKSLIFFGGKDWGSPTARHIANINLVPAIKLKLKFKLQHCHIFQNQEKFEARLTLKVLHAWGRLVHTKLFKNR